MQGDPKEFELKLELSKTRMEDVAAAAASKRFAVANPLRRKTQTVYFDTADQALRQAGISIRLRRSQGAWMQSFKHGTAVQTGISNPTEIETRVPDGKLQLDRIPSGKARKQLRKVIGDDKLKPVFRTDYMRSTYRLKSADTDVELALDDGNIAAQGKKKQICEAELELKAGDVTAMLKIAQHLFAGVPFNFSSCSKAERAYRLIAPDLQETAKPVKASRPELKAKDSAAEAFARICQACADQILNNWQGLRTSDDPEYAHQMRVGVRRLRTALRAFRGVIDTPATRALSRDLARFGRRVGELRDIDVLLADIVQPVELSSKLDKGAGQLEALLAKRVKRIREGLRRELRQTGWNALVLQVSLLPHGAGWADAPQPDIKISEHAAAALGKCWKRVTKRACRLDDLSTEERHELRKDLKTLRYTLEFFGSLLPTGKSRKFIARLRSLQDSFGYLNDVALAQTLPAIVANAAQKNPQLRQIVGDVLTWHNREAANAWQNTQEQWRQLEKQSRPWG